MLPLILAGVIWTYNICKIVERAGAVKSDEPADAEDKDSEEGEGDESVNISNSAEAIKHIKNQQKSDGQRNRQDYGGERYGKSFSKFKRR